ncbi:hypothetical protein ACHWQZ_G004246 [Mnemiopsis leidyi]
MKVVTWLLSAVLLVCKLHAFSENCGKESYRLLPVTGKRMPLKTPLHIGDTIAVCGIFGTKVNDNYQKDLNLAMEDDNFMILHMALRSYNGVVKVALNSLHNSAWQAELAAPLGITHVEGETLLVEIKCHEDGFHIFLDKTPIGITFPYRSDFSLQDVKYLTTSEPYDTINWKNWAHAALIGNDQH